ncbi:Lrp/AsnC family transcriptional regulator [Nocardia sp. NEAU-G5]|uniref:Lrp/AsnC family transcriptional regulator n=1 Tax=Nocardia albiluteola TaxID=2842303 RepID=A0ABS6AYC0_9NOCA|nr:Lrp/AsnC family transcriptional regulator [Nocardia albiluteola]MBU3063047.1 Lrp/AsnC family transcriptional regulator [Nocardia albiluteola]
MKDFGRLDEVDAAIVNALQISPRASWARVAQVLQLDAVTVARRWKRLADAGAAWVSGHPGPMLAGSGQGCMAFIEIDCVNGQLPEVAEHLTQEPTVVTVQHVTGGRNLLITVIAPGLGELSRWISGALGSLGGVIAARTHLVGAIHTHASRWRLHALASDRAAQLAPGKPARRSAVGQRLSTQDRELMVALSEDGRASYTDLAARCGIGVDTARRRTAHLIDSEAVLIRCDIARPLIDRPVAVVLWAEVASHALERAAQAVAGLRDVRLCAGIAGRHNLLIIAWVRAPDDIQRFETRVSQVAPGIVIGDRSVVLSSFKVNGHLLDEDGYRVGCVPIDPWNRSADHDDRAGRG